ncbi:MAG: hypothetical protein ACTMIR_00220 [Cellulomonadaceae bacterium]
MLGRSERESGAHALLAAQIAGWGSAADRDEPSDVLNLGSMTTALATVSHIDGLAAVVFLGHPTQPAHDLERALLAADSSLLLTGAVAVVPEWVWVGRRAQATGHVVVDEAGMRDCRHVLRTLGATPHLVPARTPVSERLAMAGAAGSLVVERNRVPAGFEELPGSERLAVRPPIWYGLVESWPAPPEFTEPAQVWFAFGPRVDHRGSLQDSLAVFAENGIDLQHLRSQQSVDAPHAFYTSFRCDSSGELGAIVAAFSGRGIAHRILGVLPGQDFLPGSDAIVPRWAQAQPAGA